MIINLMARLYNFIITVSKYFYFYTIFNTFFNIYNLLFIKLNYLALYNLIYKQKKRLNCNYFCLN